MVHIRVSALSGILAISAVCLGPVLAREGAGTKFRQAVARSSGPRSQSDEWAIVLCTLRFGNGLSPSTLVHIVDRRIFSLSRLRAAHEIWIRLPQPDRMNTVQATFGAFDKRTLSAYWNRIGADAVVEADTIVTVALARKLARAAAVDLDENIAGRTVVHRVFCAWNREGQVMAVPEKAEDGTQLPSGLVVN